MDALGVSPRFRLGPVLEWLVAAVFLLATFGVGSLIFRELRPAAAPGLEANISAAAARPAVPSTPAAVPAGAVAVPLLPFVDGKEVRVGETVGAVAARLGRSAEVGRQELDRGSFGERWTRFYEYAGSKFILVFEPLEPRGEPKVSAIYIP